MTLDLIKGEALPILPQKPYARGRGIFVVVRAWDSKNLRQVPAALISAEVIGELLVGGVFVKGFVEYPQCSEATRRGLPCDGWFQFTKSAGVNLIKVSP